MKAQIVMVFGNSDPLKQAEDMSTTWRMYPKRAKTGEHLLKLIEDGYELITITRDKFDKAMNKRDAEKTMKKINQEDLFIIFDEFYS